MSDYPCPECGQEGRGLSAHKYGCSYDRVFHRERYTFKEQDRYYLLKQRLPWNPEQGFEEPDFALEKPTGKGRFR